MARRKTNRGRTTGQPTAAARKPRAKTRAVKSKAPPVIAGASLLSRGRSDERSAVRRFFRRIVLLGLIAGVLICLLPVALTFLYKSSSVHPVSTLMAWNWIRGENVRRDWVPFDEISPNVWQAVVSSEDGQFCRHDGVDWAAVDEVIDEAMDGEPVRGASTIPMQTVKNLFLWSSRSYVRKALEVPLAMLVDTVWGKKRLMEIYLNIAEWGPGIYGIEAAAQHHFDRSAGRLSRRQAALLAVTLPNPIMRDPRKPGNGMLRLARRIEGMAKRSGAYVRCLR